MRFIVTSTFACVLFWTAAFADESVARVALRENEKHFTLSNGLVRAEISRASGEITRLWLGDKQILGGRGYLSWHAGVEENDGLPNCHQVTPEAIIAASPNSNNGAKAEVVFVQKDKGNVDVELHYVMLPGERALRMFAVFSHPAGRDELHLGIARFAMRVQDSLFETLSIDAGRFGEMPPSTTPVQSLGPKEAMRVTDGPDKGRVLYKYTCFTDAGEHFVHGWTGKNSKLGCWIVYGSTEDQNSGPTRQHNTAHWPRVLLKVLTCGHFGAEPVRVPKEQSWQKLYGPWMIYLNEGGAPRELRADAERQAAAERAAWPATWLDHPAFAKAAERGSVRGRLLVRDPQAPGATAGNAWVGLAEPSPDWQRQALNYQFWARADAQGNFNIPSVRAGRYTLYAFADGVLGEFRRDEVTVKAGDSMDMGDLVWTPARLGKQLWEIGTPDRTAKEFRHGDDYRQWGLWLKYPLDFPNDVTFVIGKSDLRRDWNFAQMPRPGAGGKFVPANWRVLFDCDETLIKTFPPEAAAYLRLAIAGVQKSGLRIVINGREAARLRDFGSDSALARAGIHGQYSARDIRFSASWLRAGQNELRLEPLSAKVYSQYIMYDYLRLEVP